MRRLVPGVLSIAVALVAAGCSLGGGGGTYSVTIYFPRAVALYESSQVRVLGLPAGHVTDIEVETDRVRVELSMDTDVPVPADASAALVPQSLIGERYVQLMPAWREGEPRLSDLPEGQRIIQDDAGTPRDDVIVPVEPDEALAAVNEFLKSLDPNGLGRLIGNLADDLEGNGQVANDALSGLSTLVTDLAQHDDELASIVDNFDEFTRTLVTREGQLGELLDSFSQTTSILAQERQNLESLLAGLARVSSDGLDLVSEHATELRTDVDTVTRLAQSLVANLDAVGQLIEANPQLADGFRNAYDPATRATNLRTQLGPLASSALNPVLRFLLGDPSFTLPCIPIDTQCESGPLAGLAASDAVPAPSLDAAAPAAPVVATTTPIDHLLDLLGSPSAVGHPAVPSRSTAERVGSGAGSLGRFLRDAAGALLGAGS